MSLVTKKPYLIIVMGVSGTGKSTIAQQIANALNYTMMEADDFHSLSAREKMAQSLPLNDQDREPWINAMLGYLKQQAHGGQDVVLAYSGLRKTHREQFRQLPYQCHYLYLAGDKGVLAERLRARQGHFFGHDLLQSQFEAFDIPQADEKDVTIVDVEQSVTGVVEQIMKNIDGKIRNNS